MTQVLMLCECAMAHVLQVIKTVEKTSNKADNFNQIH